MKPTKHETKVATIVVAILLLFFSLIFYSVISAEPKPKPKPKPRPTVYYDKIEIFDAQGKSSFRTPGGWSFAYALPDGTVFIKKRVKE